MRVLCFVTIADRETLKVALLRLGYMYENGQGTRHPSPSKAFEYYNKALKLRCPGMLFFSILSFLGLIVCRSLQ